MHAFVCMYVCMYAYSGPVPVFKSKASSQSPQSLFDCAQNVTQTSCKSIQDFLIAFMMGTHARLGAHSPVLLLDPYLAVCIAQIIIADRW